MRIKRVKIGIKSLEDVLGTAREFMKNSSYSARLLRIFRLARASTISFEIRI